MTLMDAYFTYLTEATICATVIFLFYVLVIRNLTFYQVRRFFLLFALVLSLVIPAAEIRMEDAPLIEPVSNTSSFVRKSLKAEAWSNVQEEKTPTLNPGQEEAQTMPSVNYGLILWVIYALVCLTLTMRLIISLMRIFIMKREALKEVNDTLPLYIHPLAAPAFSFIRYVFIHPDLKNDGSGKSVVVQHERCHIRQGHTYDILFVELVKIVFWFNPVIYLIKKELVAVHEFIADRQVAGHVNREHYSNLLISFAKHKYKINLTHAFVRIPLKSRIVQLFRKRSANWQLSRLLLVFPIIGILVLSFSCASEFEIQTSLPTGEKVRSIKVRYLDEFGDMPRYDGKHYSSVEFDRRGKIVDLKRGTFYLGLSTHVLPEYTMDNIVWFLDYGHYNGFEDYFAFGIENTFLQKVKHDEEIAKLGLGKFEINRNSNGKLLSINTEYFHEKFEGSRKYSFTYDQQGRLESSTVIFSHSRNGDSYSSTDSKYYKYDGFDQLSYIGSENIYVEIFNNPNGKVAETIIYKEGKMLRRFEYTYNDLGLRATSVGYNKENEKEFTLEFEYRFF